MFEKNKELHNVFRHACSQRNKIFSIPEEIKYFSWVNTTMLSSVNQEGMTFTFRDHARMRVILRYTSEHQNFHL
jgi:hypothetical protein